MSQRNWAESPMFYIPQKACPKCDHTKSIIVRTLTDGGVKTQLHVCKSCAQHYRIIRELPEPGDWVEPIMYNSAYGNHN